MPVVRHGDDGVVRGLNDEAMFYYFSPRCGVVPRSVETFDYPPGYSYRFIHLEFILNAVLTRGVLIA